MAGYVQAIGKVRFGVGTADGQQWCRVQLHKLKGSNVESIIRSISYLKLTTAAGEETRESGMAPVRARTKINDL